LILLVKRMVFPLDRGRLLNIFGFWFFIFIFIRLNYDNKILVAEDRIYVVLFLVILLRKTFKI